jgi:hypothetical protein
MKTYDIAVIGAGASGVMAAIRSAEFGKNVALIERNDAIGRKILITGKGRCNITNAAPIETFIKKFGKSGEFFRTAFFKFSNDDLCDFLRSKDLELKTERQGRVFPATDKATSVICALEQALARHNIEIMYNMRLARIKKKDGHFTLLLSGDNEIEAGKVVIATGGASYKATGSTGDGYDIAASLGHKISPLSPGLVPLKTKESWVKELQGLGLENIRITFECGKKKMVSDVGELMFTHFGVSGPLVLDLSGEVVRLVENYGEVKLFIDLKPGLREEQLDSKLIHKFKIKGSSQLNNVLKDMLPLRLIDVFIDLLGTRNELKTSQVTQDMRRDMIRLFKALPLTVISALPVEEAMVTCGGVLKSEINPRTMESKKVPGLYFAGEVIEGGASSGGYNLQQAFSTGYLAGESAACEK